MRNSSAGPPGVRTDFAETVFWHPMLVADADGRAGGCAVDQFMDLRQEESTWKGAELLAAEGVQAYIAGDPAKYQPEQ